MRRTGAWIELNVIARPLPEKTRASQQIMRLIGCVAAEAQSLEIHRKPTGLNVMRIEIDRDDNNIQAVATLFRVANDLFVIDVVETTILSYFAARGSPGESGSPGR